MFTVCGVNPEIVTRQDAPGFAGVGTLFAELPAVNQVVGQIRQVAPPVISSLVARFVIEILDDRVDSGVFAGVVDIVQDYPADRGLLGLTVDVVTVGVNDLREFGRHCAVAAVVNVEYAVVEIIPVVVNSTLPDTAGVGTVGGRWLVSAGAASVSSGGGAWVAAFRGVVPDGFPVGEISGVFSVAFKPPKFV